MTTPSINKLLRASPVNCKYGAPMGACSYFDNPDEPLYVQRVRFVDGDYTPAGVYFGGKPSEPLWCAFSVDGSNRVYVRGCSRYEAMEKVLSDYPEARFRRREKSSM